MQHTLEFRSLVYSQNSGGTILLQIYIPNQWIRRFEQGFDVQFSLSCVFFLSGIKNIACLVSWLIYQSHGQDLQIPTKNKAKKVLSASLKY